MSVSLRLPDDLSQRLSNLASQTGRSKTFYMLEAIKQHIDDLEDLYLAELRLLDVRAGRSMTHSMDDVGAALAWRIEFEDTALKELAKLDKQVARRILTFLRERVAVLMIRVAWGGLKGSRLGSFGSIGWVTTASLPTSRMA